jgi:hypothetical protein
MKVSSYLNKHHDLKTRGLDIYAHVLTILALDEGERSLSLSRQFSQR